MNNYKSEKRSLGIDLLRLITMYMIVLFHVLNHGGVIDAVSLEGIGQFSVTWAMEAIICCSVDIYAIISGYVGYTTTEKARSAHKFIILWLQVEFYSVTFYLMISSIMGVFSAKELIKSCLPITTTQYWYFTAYAGVYMISPWINRIIRQMDDTEVKKSFFCFSGVFLFYISVVGILYNPFKLMSGYSFIWLTILYILGAFIKRLDCSKSSNTRILISCLILCWCISFLTKMLIPSQNVFITYTSITTIGMSVAFVLIFSKVKIESCKLTGKTIKFLSPATFGVYLIHDNNLIRQLFIGDKFEWIAILSPWEIIAIVCGIAGFIFIIALSIELIRIKFFDMLKINEKVKLILEKLNCLKYKKF